MEGRKIREICEWHNVNPCGAEKFNDGWILSRTGDMIGGMNWSYGIYDNNLLGCNWPTHLVEKVWFNPRLFVPAFIEALCRAGIDELSVDCGQGREVVRPGEHRNDTAFFGDKTGEIQRFSQAVYGRTCHLC